jgi:hypothetical protein
VTPNLGLLELGPRRSGVGATFVLMFAVASVCPAQAPKTVPEDGSRGIDSVLTVDSPRYGDRYYSW